ncbi:MAG: hypothetical protein Gaeavirus5_17 [Gaeavirus sp.]|uniref:Uncharacterized protein n=1 Tax=Gaeavirus sp. TaxID=2487767 RepID=A0A3G4ZYT6_9VIRU|nr:MAG: hypothetical protein Gaeavirus5_17 [Gaeavirus sp.]
MEMIMLTAVMNIMSWVGMVREFQSIPMKILD